MALPKIVQKLFSDEGKGSKLRPDIVPTTINGNSPDSEGNFTPDQTGCLPNTGGTVRGPVTIQHGYRGLSQKLPSDSIYTDHAFLDQGGNLFGNIRVTKNANGSSNIGISANGKDANGSTTWRSLEVGANSDGSSPYIKFNGDGVLTTKTGLPLSGGEMTGVVKTSVGDFIAKTTNDSYLCLNGGVNSSSGARIVLSGQYREGLEGRFTLVARDASNEKSLTGSPSGSLTWNNKEVLTTKNGLPLAGGTMTGTIKSSNNSTIMGVNDTNSVGIYSATTNTNGAWMTLRSKGHANSGWIEFYAQNGTQSTGLVLKPNGSLTWGGKNVITSAGGTLTGTITSNAYPQIRGGTDNTGRIALHAGKDNGGNSGAKFSLHGADYSESGWFILQSGNSSGYKQFIGKPDGTLTWGGNNVITNHYTGAIVLNRETAHIHKPDGTGRIVIRGGSSSATDGASLYLNGTRYGTETGGFTLQARKSDGTALNLTGLPDGSLKWNGQSLLSGVNVKAYVKETWKSGASGYRIWSDGFIEQWGNITGISSDSDKTITLHKAFSNTNYNLQFQHMYTSHANVYTYPKSKTKTNFVAHSWGVVTSTDWYACGY